MQTFHYTNTYGIPKILNIADTPYANGKYHCMLWEAQHGEFCGSNELTIDQIRIYFENNRIQGTFEPKEVRKEK